MRRSYVLSAIVVTLAGAAWAGGQTGVDLSADVLRDKIRGGLLGQILGNLNGLPHENKYIHEPGNLTEFTPALPDGARTDDDTDFEWVYIYVMQQEDTILLPPARIAQLWKERINRRIWCSNCYARYLMDLGLEPPLTGRAALNPWAEFNISGQFLCETFGLIAPAMPQTASRIGLNYTSVAIDLEPAQSTQLYCTMIADAFVTSDMDELINAGLAALDPNSIQRRIIIEVRQWHKQDPADWRVTRRLLRDKYSQANGAMRDRNGYELITGSTIGALLYGDGDLAKTLMMAYNFGWDADNSAATAGTIIGTMRGYRWILSKGYKVVDRYHNTTRDNMPMDETITSFADRLLDLAEKVITERGGARRRVKGRPVYRIRTETPANVRPMPSRDEQAAEMKTELADEIEAGILRGRSNQQRARAAYLAICLDMALALKQKHPDRWQDALDALGTYWKVMQNIYYQAEVPAGGPLREKANAAGLTKPTERRPVWQ